MEYDATAIGSGHTGMPLVFKLVEFGEKVAFIERVHLTKSNA
ncbi:hypothetical protein SAMN05444412_11484 [Rhodonellum ikkaensis]|nr:hypothetical protein SAMN05444412_11484 [Rhodonellum ikkaensis]